MSWAVAGPCPDARHGRSLLPGPEAGPALELHHPHLGHRVEFVAVRRGRASRVAPARHPRPVRSASAPGDCVEDPVGDRCEPAPGHLDVGRCRAIGEVGTVCRGLHASGPSRRFRRARRGPPPRRRSHGPRSTGSRKLRSAWDGRRASGLGEPRVPTELVLRHRFTGREVPVDSLQHRGQIPT